MYVATINTPGYLPDSDAPSPVFESVFDAWSYLLEERDLEEEDTLEEGDTMSNTRHELLRALVEEATGTVYGDTPGLDPEHDLGRAYTVSVAEELHDYHVGG